jgi:uncharacterized protein (TIGR02588 family)
VSAVRRERTPFEWTILGVSVAAILVIFAGLIAASIGYESGPAKLTATLDPDATAEDRFVLKVTNDGGATAEEVRVLVRRGRGSVEVQFRAVPKGDVEEALVTIGGSGEPTAHVQSYQEP